MAVYTDVSDQEIAGFVSGYALGSVVACKGISEGVENTNYLLVTTTGTYILTLYEKRVEPADLPFFLSLMEHLAARGMPCPVTDPRAGRESPLQPRRAACRHRLVSSRALAAAAERRSVCRGRNIPRGASLGRCRFSAAQGE